MARYLRETCEDDCGCHGKKEYASKGVAGAALGIGIGGLSLAVVDAVWNCWRSGRKAEAEGICRSSGVELMAVLPAIMAMMQGNGHSHGHGCCDEPESKESSRLRQENAILKSERFTDEKLLEVYAQTGRENQRQDDRNNGNFKEAFQSIAKLDKESAVAAAVAAEKEKCLTARLDRLGTVVERHSEKLCEVEKTEAVTEERLMGLATAQKAADKSLRQEFWAALNSEKSDRECCCDKLEMRLGWEARARKDGDDDVMQWTNCNFVRNKKVLDPDQICPPVPTKVELLEAEIAALKAAKSGAAA